MVRKLSIQYTLAHLTEKVWSVQIRIISDLPRLGGQGGFAQKQVGFLFAQQLLSCPGTRWPVTVTLPNLTEGDRRQLYDRNYVVSLLLDILQLHRSLLRVQYLFCHLVCYSICLHGQMLASSIIDLRREAEA